MTHVTVEGHSVNAHRLSPRDDVTIPRGRFPEFELTISGHIHKAERIGGGQFYYVGALDRMDAGERDYQPRVLLADISPNGLRDIQSLPLDPTPIVEVQAGSEEDLIREHAWMKEPSLTLVKLTLRVPYGHYTAPLIAKARELFPRLYGNVEHIWEDKPTMAAVAAELNPADVPGTIRRYLEQQDLDAEERAALLELVEELRRS
jgi:DNA repair exonuclease SbcCD nuclease subunit